MGTANFSGPLANSQGFLSPQALIAPDQAVEQQQVQRQSELAAALRQMSFEPIDASNGGNISWTQGMAKIAQAIAGRIVQNRADKQQKSLNQVMSQRMGSMFGQQGGGGQASGGGGQAPPPASIAPPAPAMNVPDAPSAAPSGVPQAPSPTMPQPGQADTLAALPPPQMAPQQAPQQQGRGPWSLSGNPQQDMAGYMLNPEEYGKAVIGNMGKGSAPTDVEIMQQHLVAAANRGDMGAVQAISAALQKANRMPIESVRQNSIGYDPNTGAYRYTPKLGDGQTPTIDATGNVTSVNVLPGAGAATSAMAAAEAAGKGAGGSPYELVTVVDAQGNPHQVPKSLLLGGGGGAPPPSSPSGGGAPTTGTIGGYYANQGGLPGGMTNQSGLGPQAQNAATTAGTNSANVFNEAITGAQTGKDALRAINNITTAARGLSTGTGAGELSTTKSGFNAMADGLGVSGMLNPLLAPYGKQVGFNRDMIAKFDEMKKNVANLADQLSKGGGSTGTDSRLTNAINSLPSDHYSPAAIQEVGWNLSALAQRNVSYGAVAAQWQAQHGPGDGASMQSAWQKAYNADLFYHMQRGDLKQWQGTIKSPTALAHVIEQAKALRSLGAFQ